MFNSSKICLNCNSTNPAKNKFCWNCSCEFAIAIKQVNNRNNKTLFLVIPILLASIIGAIYYWLNKSNDKNVSENETRILVDTAHTQENFIQSPKISDTTSLIKDIISNYVNHDNASNINGCDSFIAFPITYYHHNICTQDTLTNLFEIIENKYSKHKLSVDLESLTISHIFEGFQAQFTSEYYYEKKGGNYGIYKDVQIFKLNKDLKITEITKL